MPDIFLRPGAANPSNIVLRDPTLPDAGGVIELFATAVLSAEAFGTPGAILVLEATGIASAIAFGQSSLQAILAASGVETGYVAGEPILGVILEASGVATGLVWGIPGLVQNLLATGIDGAEAFGYPSIGLIYPLVATGVPSGLAFGIPTATRDYIIARIVKDKSKNLVAGVSVSLFSTYNKQLVDQTETDAAGAYHFHIANQTTEHFIVMFKTGPPLLAGVTLNTLTGM
jgi:hypothetical protein